MKKTVLNKEDLMELIPHRDPYLMIDECEVMDKGKKGTGIKKLTGKEFFFEGHFPGRPIMPGVLVIEAIYQTALAVTARRDLKLLKIKKIKFRQTIEPGDIVKFEIDLVKSFEKELEFSARVYVDESVAASGEIVLSSE